MKISSNWLSEFISLNNKTIEQELTQLGLEVDTISKNKNDYICLLYTSDAADDGLGVDLGGRRII